MRSSLENTVVQVKPFAILRAYSDANRAVMLFDTKSRIEIDPGADTRKLLLPDAKPAS